MSARSFLRVRLAVRSFALRLKSSGFEGLDRGLGQANVSVFLSILASRLPWRRILGQEGSQKDQKTALPVAICPSPLTKCAHSRLLFRGQKAKRYRLRRRA